MFWQLNRFLLMFVIKNKYYYNYSFFVLFQISLILVRIVACTVENTWAHDLAGSNRILIGFDFVTIFERIFVLNSRQSLTLRCVGHLGIGPQRNAGHAESVKKMICRNHVSCVFPSLFTIKVMGWGQLIIIFLCVNIYIVEWRDFGQVGSSSGKKGRSTLKFIILKAQCQENFVLTETVGV